MAKEIYHFLNKLIRIELMFENISWLFLCLFLPLKKSAYTAILLNSIVTKSQQVPKVVGIRDLSKRGYSQSCPNAPCMYDISLHLPYISDKLYRQKFPVPWGGIFGAKSCHQDSVKKKNVRFSCLRSKSIGFFYGNPRFLHF